MSEQQKVELRDNGSFQNEVYNLCSSIFLAPERDVDLPLKAEDSADDDEPKAEEQEDEGDWEQVGPKNKSMVTRMVSAPHPPFPPPPKKKKEKKGGSFYSLLFLIFSKTLIFSAPGTHQSYQKKLKDQN